MHQGPSASSLLSNADQTVNSDSGSLLARVDGPPIDLLPVELFQRIFTTVAAPPSSPWYRTPAHVSACRQATSSSYLIASVCTKWRAIAHQMHELWACIALPDAASLTSNHYSLTMNNIKLSGTAPLDIILDATSSDTALIATDVVPVVLNQAWRWRRCQLYIPHWFLTLLCHVLGRDLPLLEELQLTVRDLHERNGCTWTLPSCAKLQRLTITCNFIGRVADLSNLRFLDVYVGDNSGSDSDDEGIIDEPLWNALQLAPNLTDLHMHFPKYRLVGLGPRRAMNLPKLERVGIYGHLKGLANTIQYFEWPNVTEFITLSTYLLSLQPLLQHLAPTIRRLTIKQPPDPWLELEIRDADRIMCLSRLETLEIWGNLLYHVELSSHQFFARVREGWEDQTLQALQILRIIEIPIKDGPYDGIDAILELQAAEHLDDVAIAVDLSNGGWEDSRLAKYMTSNTA